MIFETMAFRKGAEVDVIGRYSTLKEAIDGHEAAVKEIEES
jgi:hypothetical protein